MTKRARTPALWLVTWESRSFAFQGVGATLAQAEGALIRALDQHGIEYRCEPGWYGTPAEVLEWANQQKLVAGTGYRDSAPLVALPGVAE